MEKVALVLKCNIHLKHLIFCQKKMFKNRFQAYSTRGQSTLCVYTGWGTTHQLAGSDPQASPYLYGFT